MNKNNQECERCNNNSYDNSYNNLDLTIHIKLLNQDAKLPQKQTQGSAGYDLFAAHDCVIEPKTLGMVKFGFAIAVPFGYEAQIRSRSGLAYRNQVFVLNSPGTVDSDYRGEVAALLMNLSDNAFEIKKHDRVAQMIFAQVNTGNFLTIEEFTQENLDRTGGWGSTGK